jgi:hypothetical protein
MKFTLINNQNSQKRVRICFICEKQLLIAVNYCFSITLVSYIIEKHKKLFRLNEFKTPFFIDIFIPFQ